DRLRPGLPGREDELEHALELIRAMGRLGIGVWCYNWMAVVPWARTSTSSPARGGAAATGFDLSVWADAPDAPDAPVDEERLWTSLAWFLERVVPAAEEAGVRLALHPGDTPAPLPSGRGPAPRPPPGRPPAPVASRDRPDRSLAPGLRACLRARPEPRERDDDVPGKRRVDDRRPARRDPSVRVGGPDPLRSLPRRAWDS